MSELETEMAVVRNLYERRFRTLKRVQRRLKSLDKNSPDWSSGELALKIAESELASARRKLKRLVAQARAANKTEAPLVTLNRVTKRPRVRERDHFIDALKRLDPKDRLLLSH